VIDSPATPAPPATAIRIDHLSKRYDSGLLAIEDVSLDVASGEFLAVVGPSGCGKSTLMRILAGLDTPTSGTSTILTQAAGRSALPAATVFQEYSLFPWMRVAENVAFAFESLDVPKDEVRARTAEILELVGLEKFHNAYPHELSGGMKQRAAVARGFVVDAPVLFMDEPFGALDEQTRVNLVGELGALWERTKKTVVFITHGIEEAVTLADRVVVMSKNPGRFKEILTIDLPRPRDAVHIRADKRFSEYVVRIWDLLR
jgi:NitT/TauT family transport system ATP-binding protein